MGAEAKIKQLGITFPPPAKPVGNYIPGVRVGNLLFLSGHGPVREGSPTARGKLGRDLSTEEGYKVAREVGINLLGSARSILGSLDKAVPPFVGLSPKMITPTWADPGQPSASAS